MRVEFVCAVCDRTVMRDGIRGNQRQLRKLCDSCIQWHRWCSWGNHAPLKSSFFANSSRPDGTSTVAHCKQCLPYTRGRKVLQCRHCRIDYLPSVKSNRHNGSGVPLCDDCYGVVKHCNKCDQTKPVDEFTKAADKACGRSAYCKSCVRQQWKDTPFEEKFRHRQRKFEISHEEWTAMRIAQNDLCAICGSAETDIVRGQTIHLSIDHCHETGLVRSLLCGRCNKAIGLMLDDPERLRAAADYLEKWAAAHTAIR